MTTKPLPDQKLLLELVRYDAETGELFWKARDAGFAERQGWSLNYLRFWNEEYTGKPAFCTLVPSGYLAGDFLGEKFRAHRIIWKMTYGTDPELIDHVDGNRRNNRLQNMRDVSDHENQKNRRLSSNSSTGICGVNRCKQTGKWAAKIQHKGRRIMLGRFPDLESAAAARKQAERRYGFHENHGR